MKEHSMSKADMPTFSGTSQEKKRPYVRWTFYLVIVCVFLLAVVAAGLVHMTLSGRSPILPAKGSGPVTGEARRDLAGKLLSAGLKGKAIEQYTLYLAEGDIPTGRRANMAYTIGKLCMEEGRYEDALSWLYQVEMIDPKSNLAPEAGAKIVACLERLGRFAQAQYSLETRSGLDKNPRDEFKGGEVVATIGSDVITRKELDEAMDTMPPWMRQTFEDPEQKKAFLQQYVAEELLYRKAKKLEMDKDPQVRKQVERAHRQLLVQRLLEDEIKEKVSMTPEDIELYYRANQDRYREKEAYKVRMIQVSEERFDGLQKALREGEDFARQAEETSLHEETRASGGLLDEWIQEGMDPTGMGDPGKLWKALVFRREGDICGPIKTNGMVYLFRVETYRAPQDLPMEEVQKRVEQDLYRERVEKTHEELVRQALQGSDVKLFPEVLMKDSGKKKEPHQAFKN